jgi:hypothetical protein
MVLDMLSVADRVNLLELYARSVLLIELGQRVGGTLRAGGLGKVREHSRRVPQAAIQGTGAAP